MTAPQTTPALPDRWFRTTPDSSVRSGPRLLARSLIHAADLDERIGFYEQLFGVPADLRMPIPDFGGLELAAVGNLLLIASVRPFTQIQRQTAYSLIVPSLAAQLDTVRRAGGTVVEPPERILPGARARVRYPDGSLAELVEHRPQPGEEPRPPAEATGGDRAGRTRLVARRKVPRTAFDETVAAYEKLLETEARVHEDQHRPGPLALALVGNLLLIGSDEPDPASGAAAAVALLASAEGHGQRAMVPLPDGVLAEVWDLDAVGRRPGL
ncbi:lactoylglutathione lyase [Streptomyces sp. NPDC007100]|uniref:VOC family protein n=1 Tax=Streptomyces sp. NPDC007100 TaxID=3155602 RepID=UPI0033DB6AA1